MKRSTTQALYEEALGSTKRRDSQLSRAVALAYMEADANDDGHLSFDEFKSVARRMAGLGHVDIEVNDRAVRELFDSIDTQGSGTIEMDEYFMWSLTIAKNLGCGLEAIFEHYDTSGEGTLDITEFAFAVEDMGFPTCFATDLFLEIDADSSVRLLGSTQAHLYSPTKYLYSTSCASYLSLPIPPALLTSVSYTHATLLPSTSYLRPGPPGLHTSYHPHCA